MDRIEFRDDLRLFLNVLVLSWFYIFNFISSEVLQKDFPLECEGGKTLENISEVVGNPLVNLLEGTNG
jgi:hypothetical protein